MLVFNKTEIGSSLEVWTLGYIRAGWEGPCVGAPPSEAQGGHRALPLCTNGQSPVQAEDQGPQTRAPETVQMHPEWSHPGPERKVLLGNPRGHKLWVMLLVTKFREAPGPGDKPHQCGWTSLELNRMPTCLSPVEGALSPQEDGLAFFSQPSPQEEGEECWDPSAGQQNQHPRGKLPAPHWASTRWMKASRGMQSVGAGGHKGSYTPVSNRTCRISVN